MSGCLLCGFVGLALKYYLYAWVACLGIWFALIVLSRLGSDEGNKLRYYAKYGMVYFATQALATLYVPVAMLRPRNPASARTIATAVSYASKLLPITWELRNAQVLREPRGAVVMANHQSSMDILGLMVLWSIMWKVISIAKREMLFLFPFGPAAWISGLTFINRKNRASAVRTLDGCKRRMVDEGYKMYLYPEGTRYPEKGLLPFKKGGFHTAIEAGVPIVAVVFSHMYFIDAKRHVFRPGHVIMSVLDPIPTEGLTKDNLDELIQRTRDAMLAEYEKISAEMERNLANPEWVRKDRPRLAITEDKKVN